MFLANLNAIDMDNTYNYYEDTNSNDIINGLQQDQDIYSMQQFNSMQDIYDFQNAQNPYDFNQFDFGQIDINEDRRRMK